MLFRSQLRVSGKGKSVPVDVPLPNRFLHLATVGGRSLIEKSCGKNILIQEAIVQKLDNRKAELEGSNPTPIERLLAERAALCWYTVHSYEMAYANASGWNISQADLQHRQIDNAHARFLSSVRTLAQVRKLALPTLQVNIARNQVNVAETRS